MARIPTRSRTPKFNVDSPRQLITQLLQLELLTEPDYERILPLDRLKNWLRVTADVDDADIIALRQQAFQEAFRKTKRMAGEAVVRASYYNIADRELLPFAYATAVNSLTVDGTIVDSTQYSLFGGRIQFNNYFGYENAEIVIEYNTGSYDDVSAEMLQAIRLLVDAEYSDLDDNEAESIRRKADSKLLRLSLNAMF